MGLADTPRTGRRAWVGALFFVVLGGLDLALDPGGLIGWVSVVGGMLSGLALWAVRQGWIGPRASSASPRPRSALSGSRAGVASRCGAAAPPPPHSPPVQLPATPVLSPDGRRRVDDIVTVLERAGAWAPATPDPALLYPAVADRGEPVTVAEVLHALPEVTFHFPDADPAAFSQRIAQHLNGIEQSADYLAEQVADLARLAGGAVVVEVRRIDQEFLDPPAGAVRTRLELSVDGQLLTLDYLGASKYLSTVLHVHLARALHGVGAPHRVAGLWGDHLLLAGLPFPATDLDALNADLGLPPGDARGVGGWTWIDDWEPVALGEANRRW